MIRIVKYVCDGEKTNTAPVGLREGGGSGGRDGRHFAIISCRVRAG